MDLTNRERLVILAALSYAYSNVDDLNDSLAHCDKNDEFTGNILIGESVTESISDNEIDRLMAKI